VHFIASKRRVVGDLSSRANGEKFGRGARCRLKWRGVQDLASAAVAGGGQRWWQRHPRCDLCGALKAGEQGRCQWAGPRNSNFSLLFLFKIFQMGSYLKWLKDGLLC
jgi:hypothetical protein